MGRIIGPLTIESLANGGNGIAREQGRVIFVSGGFPGDIVLCRLTKEKKNFAEGEVAELQQPSPLRRQPPCPVADQCGGCQWQQLPYSEQLKWKQQLYSDTLSRQAGIDPALIQPITPAPEEFGYRSRVQVKCCYTEGDFVSGFFRPKSRFVVGVDQCPLMAPKLNRLLLIIREAITASLYAPKISQIDLAIGSDDALRAVVHSSGSDEPGLKDLLHSLSQQHNFDSAIQSASKDAPVLVRGTGDLRISVDYPEIHLNYAAGGFAQVNLDQNRNLVQAVLAAAKLSGSEKVLDLYCGMGNFSLSLARRAKSVTGVEDFSPSIAMARRNAVENGVTNVDFHSMSAELALQQINADFDLLVLDPPRAGAYSVAQQLAQHPIAKILYISCDPQTLARDLKCLLNIGYQVMSSQAFDMFPQTHHVESLTFLEYCSK